LRGWRILVAGLGVVAVAACDDSGKQESAFRKEATALCKRQQKAVQAIPDSNGSEARALELLGRHLKELRRLDAPPALAPKMERWLTAGDELLQVLHREQRVLDADMKLVDAALKRRAAAPRPKLTAWDLQHPTASIISELERLPEYKKFQRDSAAILREADPVYRSFVRLGRELGLSTCVAG
jgi:hypothetical protein